MQGEGQEPMPSSAYTLFDLFKDKGYSTGVFGKWGLGYPGSDGAPSAHGVDDFYGYNCQRYSHSYYPDHLWDNDEKVVQELLKFLESAFTFSRDDVKKLEK